MQFPLLVGCVNGPWTTYRSFAPGFKCHLCLICSTACPVWVMSDIDSSRPCRPRQHQVKVFGTADDLGERVLQLATRDSWRPPLTDMLAVRGASATLRTAENRRLSEALIFCLSRHRSVPFNGRRCVATEVARTNGVHDEVFASTLHISFFRYQLAKSSEHMQHKLSWAVVTLDISCAVLHATTTRTYMEKL